MSNTASIVRLDAPVFQRILPSQPSALKTVLIVIITRNRRNFMVSLLFDIDVYFENLVFILLLLYHGYYYYQWSISRSDCNSITFRLLSSTGYDVWYKKCHDTNLENLCNAKWLLIISLNYSEFKFNSKNICLLIFLEVIEFGSYNSITSATTELNHKYFILKKNYFRKTILNFCLFRYMKYGFFNFGIRESGFFCNKHKYNYDINLYQSIIWSSLWRLHWY